MRSRASTSVKSKALILIGYSVRAVAQIADRIGYRQIIAADLFADADTRQFATQVFCVAESGGTDIDRSRVRQWFADLGRKIPVADALFVSGLEKHHHLLTDAPKGWSWLNCSSSTVAQLRNFHTLSRTLDRLKIPYPQSRWTAPAAGESGWLAKRCDSSGGTGVKRVIHARFSCQADYWQREIVGAIISVSICAWSNGHCEWVGLSRQLHGLSSRKDYPFRFEGLISGITVTEEIRIKIIGYIENIIKEFKLVGWFGVDFVLSDHDCLLLEINPRPTAALEMFDRLACSVSPLELHVCACRGEQPSDRWQCVDNQLAGMRVLYANQEIEIDQQLEWPDWVQDVPIAKSKIDVNAPVCTVIAEHQDENELEQLLAFRAKTIEHLLQLPNN